MSELKRCPFCGDEVEIIATGLYHWKYAIHHKSNTECILDANAFALPYEEEDAIRMWNTRADRKTENSSVFPNNCDTCKYGEDKHRYAHICNECGVGINNYEPKTEPQKCSVNGKPYTECSACEHFRCMADEPQTDCIIFKGNLKEGDYKLIKTTDGWVLEGEDIVYCGWERGNE